MDYREQGFHVRGAHPTLYLAHGNSKGEVRGRNRHKNNERVVRNLEKKNVDMKEKSPEQDLTSAKNLTIELPEGRSE